MKALEEVVYEIARDALADQERLVAGIRLRTGTLVAAHALVASFLGNPALRDTGLTAPTWLALLALTAALTVAAFVLAPWRLDFSVDSRRAYDRMERYTQRGPAGWLLVAAFLHDDARRRNEPAVARMSRCGAGISILLVVQAVAWMIALT